MAGLERQDHEEESIYFQIAHAMFNKQMGKNLSENDQFLLNYYGPGGFMDEPENANFRQQILSEFNKLSSSKDNAREPSNVTTFKATRIPLFTDDELRRTSKHKKRKVGVGDNYLQPLLIPNDSNSFSGSQIDFYDPEKKIMQFGSELDRRIYSHKKNLLTEEARHNREQLRDFIGLPVARGNNIHVNDPFYKFLVRRIYFWDIFRIFEDYDRVQSGSIPDDLNERIAEVKVGVLGLLDTHIPRWQKFMMFDEFTEEYGTRWEITPNYHYLKRK